MSARRLAWFIFFMVLYCLLALASYLFTSKAHAQDDDVCKPYATASTQVLINQMELHSQKAINWFWSRFRLVCSNIEGPVPAVPRTWISGLLIVIPPSPIFSTGDIPATERPVGESGQDIGSPGWLAWCRANYPHSFDVKTGTVIFEMNNVGHRHPCPG